MINDVVGVQTHVDGICKIPRTLPVVVENQVLDVHVNVISVLGIIFLKPNGLTSSASLTLITWYLSICLEYELGTLLWVCFKLISSETH